MNEDLFTLILMLAHTHPLLVTSIIFIILISLLVIPNIFSIIRWIKRKNSKTNHHLTCPYFCDADYIKLIKPQILEAVELAYKLFELREKTLVDEQMSLVEKTQIKVKSMLVNNFRDIDNINRDARAYSKIIDFSLCKSKNKLKEFIKANHILTKTDTEYATYARKTAEILIDYHIATLDDEMYEEDFMISRAQLYKHNKEFIIPQIREVLIDLLLQIKDINKRYDVKIKELEKRIYE